MNDPPNDDNETPPDVSPSELTHSQFTRFLRKMKQCLHRNRSQRPFYIVAPKGIARYIERFNWKSGLGVSLIGCGVVCGGYWVFCIDGGSGIVTTAGAIGGYLRMRTMNDSMNTIGIDVHQRNRELLSDGFDRGQLQQGIANSLADAVKYEDWESAFGDTIRETKKGHQTLFKAICGFELNQRRVSSDYSDIDTCIQFWENEIKTKNHLHPSQKWNGQPLATVLDYVQVSRKNVVTYHTLTDANGLLKVEKTFSVGEKGQKETIVLVAFPIEGFPKDEQGRVRAAWGWIDMTRPPAWIQNDVKQTMVKYANAFDKEVERDAHHLIIARETDPEYQNWNVSARTILIEDYVMKTDIHPNQGGPPPPVPVPPPKPNSEANLKPKPKPGPKKPDKLQMDHERNTQKDKKKIDGAAQRPSTIKSSAPAVQRQNSQRAGGPPPDDPKPDPKPRLIQNAQNSSGGAGPPSDSPEPRPESPPQPRPVQNARIPPPRTQRRDVGTQSSAKGHRGAQRPPVPVHEAQPQSLRSSQGNGGQPPPSKPVKPKQKPRNYNVLIVLAVIALLSVPAACICIGLMIFIFVVQRRQANGAAVNHDAGGPPVADMV